MNKYLLFFLAWSCAGVFAGVTVQAKPARNPIIWADVPDLAIIRVGDTYYMSSTTMHMSPGLPIMKSKDLVNWRLVSYAYDTLADKVPGPAACATTTAPSMCLRSPGPPGERMSIGRKTSRKARGRNPHSHRRCTTIRCSSRTDACT